MTDSPIERLAAGDIEQRLVELVRPVEDVLVVVSSVEQAQLLLDGVHQQLPGLVYRRTRLQLESAGLRVRAITPRQFPEGISATRVLWADHIDDDRFFARIAVCVAKRVRSGSPTDGGAA